MAIKFHINMTVILNFDSLCVYLHKVYDGWLSFVCYCFFEIKLTQLPVWTYENQFLINNLDHFRGTSNENVVSVIVFEWEFYNNPYCSHLSNCFELPVGDEQYYSLITKDVKEICTVVDIYTYNTFVLLWNMTFIKEWK